MELREPLETGGEDVVLNADSVAGDRRTVDAPVHPAVPAKERGDVVAPMAQEVVIHQGHREKDE
jgi:hypothetical protein